MSPKPRVVVFTLDADTCAACTGMLRSALEAKARFGTAIDAVDRKLTRREARTKAMRSQGL